MDNIEFLLRKVQELEKRLATLEQCALAAHEASLNLFKLAEERDNMMERLVKGALAAR
jgi:hypothetical protein